MDSAFLNSTNLLSLKQAADKLSVSPNTLLSLNEYNILKPTITLTGEIGYTQEQIDNFLTIQNLSSQSNQAYVPTTIIQKPAQSTYSKIQTDSIPTWTGAVVNHNLYTDREVTASTNTKNLPRTTSDRSVPFLKISSFSFIFFTMMFLLFQTQNTLNTQHDQELASSAVEVSDSHIDMPQPSDTPISAQAKEREKTAGNNLHDESASIQKQNTTLLSKAFEKETAQTDATVKNEQILDIPQPTRQAELGNRTELKKFTSFASSPSCSTCLHGETATNSVFDNNGKIKGDTPKADLLTSTGLNSSGLNQADNPLRQSTNPLIFVAFLSLGLLSIISVFKNLPTRSAYIDYPNQIHDFNFKNIPKVQKVLEINQKTDGTVALYFNGQERKISKPELDSESDQFISRLMELVQPDVKEIDYDTLTDENIRFNTPLSKLVTRLGFVGLKRDLFFPRTSKNKVLFRKYVTENDLVSMGLTTEHISSQL